MVRVVRGVVGSGTWQPEVREVGSSRAMDINCPGGGRWSIDTERIVVLAVIQGLDEAGAEER